MGTAFFWIVWGIISFWALKTFYYSFSKEKLEGLRKANIGFTIAVLILYFLPWVPLSLDGWTGFGLAYNGNFLATLFFIFLFNSLVLFLQKEYIFLKIASLLTIFLTLDLFVLMLTVRPGTFTLSLYDIAPIVAALLLLCQIVAVLLLWQQMKLQPKTVEAPSIRKKIIIGGASVLIIILGILIFISGNSKQIPKSVEELEPVTQKEPVQKGFETFAKNEPGIVCSEDSNFSFRMNSSYNILSDDNNGIALFANNNLVTVSKNNNIENLLKDFGYEYTKEGETYFYEVLASKSADIDEGKNYGMSQEKDEFLVSVFSGAENDRESEEILSGVVSSLKEGCSENE